MNRKCKSLNIVSIGI